jgi:hypothetical protein
LDESPRVGKKNYQTIQAMVKVKPNKMQMIGKKLAKNLSNITIKHFLNEKGLNMQKLENSKPQFTKRQKQMQMHRELLKDYK